MDDQTTVVEPEMDAVETTTETSSPEVEKTEAVENQNTEDTSPVDKEADKISDDDEDLSNLAPKSQNRFQKMANEIRDLKAKIAESPVVTESKQNMSAINDWNAQYEADPNARFDPTLAATYAHNQGELLKLRSVVIEENQKFQDKYNKAVEIENTAEIFNSKSSKFSQDYLDEYQDLVFNENMDPERAYARVEKLYNAATSKASAQYKQTIAEKKSQNTPSTTPAESKSDNWKKLPVDEMRQFLIDHPEIAAQ
jgi:hypothetical protein